MFAFISEFLLLNAFYFTMILILNTLCIIMHYLPLLCVSFLKFLCVNLTLHIFRAATGFHCKVAFTHEILHKHIYDFYHSLNNYTYT